MIKRYAWLILLLLLPALAHADLYEEAEAAFSRGAYQEAISKTETLLARKPKLAAYLYLHAMSALRARRYGKAKRSFNKLVALPDDTISDLVRRKSYANYLRTLLATGEMQRAAKLAEKATEHFPDDAVLANLAGRVYLGQGAYARALTSLERSISLDGDRWPAYNNLGLVQLKAGNFAAADKAFGQAIDLGPPIPYLYNNRGGAREKLGHLHKALSDYDHALRINPGYRKARRSAERLRKLIRKRRGK